jgi:ribonuclease HII
MVIGGDRECVSIAAASVLAKVARDAVMTEAHEHFPAYRWADNKGYGSSAHLAALRNLGACDWHRRSWNLPPVDARGGAPAGA